MKTSSSEIRLPKRQLVIFLALIFFLNLVFIAGTWVFTWYYNSFTFVSREEFQVVFQKPTFLVLSQFNLASENVVATWYSSMLLLISGLGCLLCFISDTVSFTQAKEKALSYGWLGLSFIFILLSVDEVGSFHETIGDSAVFSVFGNDFVWAAFYFLIALVGLYMVGFGLIRLRSNNIAFLASAVGVLLFLSNPFQEYIEIKAYEEAANPASWHRPIGLLLLEEGTELFGSWSFMLATFVYMSGSQRTTGEKKTGSVLGAFLPLPYSRKQFLGAILLVVCALSLILATVLAYDQGPKDAEAGILENWFPSALAFAVALFCFHKGTLKTISGSIYLALAILSMGISAFYGSNVFQYYFFWGTGLTFGLLFRAFMALTSFAIAMVLWRQASSPSSRITLLLWALFLSAAFFIGRESSLEFVFIAYSLLALSLASSFKQTLAASPKPSVKVYKL
ncbi:hypothetical protein [Rufibacter latericius]|uniref:Uncharacterized protein n=1 Tax=Rufibacter latericius TaxID=2487040 RepID=A0A3M9M9G6_9BACT|nr:hypothetical protein [Rufibacter latericius]RNI21855.1 hypothetical protein EFB08_22170 [Rufibacter latericius]